MFFDARPLRRGAAAHASGGTRETLRRDRDHCGACVIGNGFERRLEIGSRRDLRRCRFVGRSVHSALRPTEARQVEAGSEDEPAEERDDDGGSKLRA